MAQQNNGIKRSSARMYPLRLKKYGPLFSIMEATKPENRLVTIVDENSRRAAIIFTFNQAQELRKWLQENGF